MARRKRRGNNEGSIFQRKDGTWCAMLMVGRKEDGSPKRVSFYGRTRQEVADRLTGALNDTKRGTFVEPSHLTVGEWLDTWLQEYKKPSLRPTTYESYEYLTRIHLKPEIGSLKLRDLRPEHLQRLYNKKTNSGLSAATVHYIHAVIRQALAQALKNGLGARNVAEATVRPRMERKEIRPLSAEQSRHFLAAIEGDRLFAAIYLELNTGLRRGELLGLGWEDVDLKAGTLVVKRELVRLRKPRREDGERNTRLLFQEPKTASSRRTIPLSKGIVAELKRWRAYQNQERLKLGAAYQDNGLVFCAPDGRPLDPRNFTRRFDLLLEKAGLPHIRFHDARHTFATLMLELGEHPKTVQQMLGHSRIAQTLDTYSHVSLELERRAADRLGEVLQRKTPSVSEGDRQ